jgi:hypothetical protein
MALVQFSSLISEIKGRSAGSVFQRVSNGLIIRTQPSIKKVSNQNIFRTRNNTALLQNIWQALSEQEKNAWETYAVFRGRKQRKNPNQIIGGQATFILENTIRLLFSQSFGVITPTILTLPTITPPPPSILITGISNTAGSLVVSTDYSIPDNSQFLFMYITRPLLPSQKSVHNKMKIIPNMSATGSTQVITSFYLDQFAILPKQGQFVNTEIFLYDKNKNTFGAGTFQRLEIQP